MRPDIASSHCQLRDRKTAADHEICKRRRNT